MRNAFQGDSPDQIEAIRDYVQKNLGLADVDWTIAGTFHAQIYNHPTATAYTDSRYYIQSTRVSRTLSATDAVSEEEDVEILPASQRIHTATNLPEYALETHHLYPGTTVWVQQIHVDKLPTPTDHYVFFQTPGITFGKATTAWKAPGDGAFVSATLCNEVGTLAPGAVAGALTLYIASDRANDNPQVNTYIEVGDVLAFMPTQKAKGRLLPVGTKSTATTSISDSSSETADSTSVSDMQHKTVTIPFQAREVYNSAGDKVLYRFYRSITYVCGVATTLSGETRVTVDSPTVACP